MSPVSRWWDAETLANLVGRKNIESTMGLAGLILLSAPYKLIARELSATPSNVFRYSGCQQL